MRKIIKILFASSLVATIFFVVSSISVLGNPGGGIIKSDVKSTKQIAPVSSISVPGDNIIGPNKL